MLTVLLKINYILGMHETEKLIRNLRKLHYLTINFRISFSCYLRVVEDGHTFIKFSGSLVLWKTWLCVLKLDLRPFFPNDKQALWLTVSGEGWNWTDDLI